jgi:hypothetical protein
VLLVLPPADHLWIGRHRVQFARLREDARGMLALGPSCVPPGAAAQPRMVSVVRIRLDSHKSLRPFKGIICDDISEFESYHLSHAVGSLRALLALANGGSPCPEAALSQRTDPIHVHLRVLMSYANTVILGRGARSSPQLRMATFIASLMTICSVATVASNRCDTRISLIPRRPG